MESVEVLCKHFMQGKVDDIFSILFVIFILFIGLFFLIRIVSRWMNYISEDPVVTTFTYFILVGLLVFGMLMMVELIRL